MCKMIISSDAFFNFSKYDFWGFQGVKVQKMAQNDKKFSLLHLYGTHM